ALHVRVASLFCHHPATTEIYTLSLHDALPIWIFQQILEGDQEADRFLAVDQAVVVRQRQVHHGQDHHLAVDGHGTILDLVHAQRSEEHTSELQSRENLVCRLLLEKKKKEHNKT